MTVPLAFTGGFLLLLMVGLPLSIIALIGLLILMGVITNNGIVLIDYVNQAKTAGMSTRDALVHGANTRTRPIMMTALSTIIALIPLGLGLGHNGAMMQPMAIVSIGGLLYGTMMSLIVIPALYAILNTSKSERAQIKTDKKARKAAKAEAKALTQATESPSEEIATV